MKKTARYLLAAALTMVLGSTIACAQNGPTIHKAVLSWKNPPTLTANCIYRGTASGVYTLPAVFCSSTPITSYTDAGLKGSTTYYYAVTAQDSTSGVVEESPYSNEANAPIPSTPAAPTMNTPLQTAQAPPDNGTIALNIVRVE